MLPPISAATAREGRTHSHDFHQLVLPLAGCLSLSLAQGEDEVTQQRAAVIPAGEVHGYYAPDDNCFLVADVPHRVAPALERLPRFVDLAPPLRHYVRFVHAQLQCGGLSSGTGQQMLLLLLRLLQEQCGAAPEPDRRVAVARQYLEDHFRESVTVSQLASVAHLSQRQLNDLFRRELGMTPHQYLLRLRMDRARRLLEQTRLSVQQVADAVGYGSLAAFSDRFSRHFGVSPTHFRGKSKENHPDPKVSRAGSA